MQRRDRFITANLYSALRKLRLHDEVVLIWCDALSINQSYDAEGLRERASQVQMMNQIFGKASRVVVDLGNRPRHFKELQNAIEQIVEIPAPQWKAMNTEVRGDSLPPMAKTICFNIGLWQAFTDILCRPYWTRAWILQEYAIARTLDIMIGDSFFSSDKFEDCAWKIFELFPALAGKFWAFREFKDVLDRVEESDHGHDFRRVVVAREERLNANFRGFTLPKLLVWALDAATTDPRDKVYALHSMTNWALAPYRLFVDYSISIQDLAIEVSKLFIASGAFRRLLELNNGLMDGSLPSWCLNLDSPQSSYRVIYLTDPERNISYFYTGGKGSPNVAEPNVSHARVISVLGCVWDTVIELPEECAHRLPILKPHGPGFSFFDLTEWDNEATKWTERFLQHRLSPAEIFEAYWHTVTGEIDSVHRPGAKRAKADFGNTYREAKADYNRVVRSRATTVYPKDMDVCNKMMNVLQASKGKRLGGTQIHNQIALLPMETKVGDEICIFVGIGLPFVMRPDIEEGLIVHRKLVGSCYLHGVMDGEALQHPSWKAEQILIG